MGSFDIKAGYRHFRLAPKVRNWYLFRYEDMYYRCVALPFGWGRSPMWLTQLMVQLVCQPRAGLGFRVLPYLDDFLVCPAKAGSNNETRLCLGSPSNKQAVGDSWFDPTPYQGRMVWLNASRAPGLHHRHQADEILYCSPENSQDTRDGSLTSTTGKGMPS
jgi:hypothetical protein